MTSRSADNSFTPSTQNAEEEGRTMKKTVSRVTESAISTLRSKPYFAADEFPSLESVAHLLVEIADTLKTPKDKENASLLKASAQILRHVGQQKVVAQTTEELVQSLSKELTGLLAGVKTNAEVLNATATTYTRLTDNAIEIQRNLQATCSKLSQGPLPSDSVPRTYSQAAASQSTNVTLAQDSVTRKIQNKHAVQHRQFVITFKEGATDTPRDTTQETALKFKTQLTNALNKVAEKTLIEPTIRSTSILKNGGILFEVKDALTAKWIREGDNKEKIATEFHPESYFRGRSYPLIARFVPVEWNPVDPDSLRDIESAHDIPINSIREASWIKNPGRRSAEQEVAHAKISCSTPEAANTLLTSTVRIAGRQVTITKDSREPTRCNKCQKYGHFAAECKEERDTCGKCGKEHRTAGCTAEATWCVSCDTINHSSISRDCPQYSKRVNALNTVNPESTLPFFPTDELWTWERAPAPKRPANRKVDMAPQSAPQGRKRTRQTTLNFGVNSIPLAPRPPRFSQASQSTSFPQQLPVPPQSQWFPQQPVMYSQPYPQYLQQPYGEDPSNSWWSQSTPRAPTSELQPGPNTPPFQPPASAALPPRPALSQPSNSQPSNSQNDPYA